jgi:hypothetical protein
VLRVGDWSAAFAAERYCVLVGAAAVRSKVPHITSIAIHHEAMLFIMRRIASAALPALVTPRHNDSGIRTDVERGNPFAELTLGTATPLSTFVGAPKTMFETALSADGASTWDRDTQMAGCSG